MVGGIARGGLYQRITRARTIFVLAAAPADRQDLPRSINVRWPLDQKPGPLLRLGPKRTVPIAGSNMWEKIRIFSEFLRPLKRHYAPVFVYENMCL